MNRTERSFELEVRDNLYGWREAIMQTGLWRDGDEATFKHLLALLEEQEQGVEDVPR